MTRDANDVHRQQGEEGVRGMHDHAREFNDYDQTSVDEAAAGVAEQDAGRQQPKQLDLWWHGDKDPNLDRIWLVEGLLPDTGTALISGQWGTYKTFVALDLALSLMTGATFAGREVNRRCGVLFLAVEGAFEIPLRLQCALEAKSPNVEVEARLPFAMASECPRLLGPSALAMLEGTARPAATRMQDERGVKLGAIIVDTMSTAALFDVLYAQSSTALMTRILSRGLLFFLASN